MARVQGLVRPPQVPKACAGPATQAASLSPLIRVIIVLPPAQCPSCAWLAVPAYPALHDWFERYAPCVPAVACMDNPPCLAAKSNRPLTAVSTPASLHISLPFPIEACAALQPCAMQCVTSKGTNRPGVGVCGRSRRQGATEWSKRTGASARRRAARLLSSQWRRVSYRSRVGN